MGLAKIGHFLELHESSNRHVDRGNAVSMVFVAFQEAYNKAKSAWVNLAVTIFTVVEGKQWDLLRIFFGIGAF